MKNKRIWNQKTSESFKNPYFSAIKLLLVTCTFAYGLKAVNQCKCSALCRSRKLNMCPCVWRCSGPGMNKTSQHKTLRLEEPGVSWLQYWYFPHGYCHLKNLSMVLQSPRFLAFLDGGEDGVSRLRQEVNAQEMVVTMALVKEIIFSIDLALFVMYNHQLRCIL